MNWHSMELEQVKRALNDKETGLSNKDIELRIITDGENTFEEEKQRTIFGRVFEQFKNSVNILIAVAFVLSVVAVILNDGKGILEAVCIFLVLALSVTLGVIIKERALKEEKSEGIFTRVLREGTVISMQSDSIVPGDIIYVESGDVVPADARLLSSSNLKCEESEIFGEMTVSEKDAEAVIDEETPLKDRINMIYSGCTVTYGSGTAIVTETGVNTCIGKIMEENSDEARPENPLVKKLKKVGVYLSIAYGAVCLLMLIVCIALGFSASGVVTALCVVTIAAVPECIFILAYIASKGGKNIKKILTSEKLGCVTVICTEKSGVLTKSKMKACEAWTKGESEKLSGKWSKNTRQLMEYAVLCSNMIYKEEVGKKKFEGEPIENAILEAAIKKGVSPEELSEKFPRVDELPFDSERKLMTTIHSVEDKYFAVVKGAPEVLVTRCSDVDKRNVLLYSNRMAKNAMRVIAVAIRELDGDYKSMSMNAIESSLTLVGIIGMTSQTREDTQKAVKRCKNAGIKTVMVTGDHLETAVAVAKEVGICKGSEQAISGVALGKLKQAQFNRSANDFTVFARVSSQDKVKIVKALQKSDETVVMTGKGINDVPAIKCADIGCAMGRKVAGLAKGAADVVFDDGNFSSVVAAVKEGRFIRLNLKRILYYLFLCAISEMTAVFWTVLFFESVVGVLPLLILNLLINFFPTLALWEDFTEKGLMSKPPQKHNGSLFTEEFFKIPVVTGILSGLFSVLAFSVGFTESLQCGATLAFLTLALGQILSILPIKNIRSIFKSGLIPNKRLLISMGIALAITLIVVFVPFVAELLGFVPLKLKHIAMAVFFSLLTAAMGEIMQCLPFKQIKVKD